MTEGIAIVSIVTTIMVLVKAVQFSILLDKAEVENGHIRCQLRISEQENSVLRNANENLRKEITRYNKLKTMK